MSSTSVRTDRAEPIRPVPRGLALAVVGLFGLLTGTLSILTLHVIPPTTQVSPLRRTISEYAYTSLGWVFNSGVVAISVGSLLIAASLWSSGTLRGSSGGSIATIGWGVGLLLLVVYPKHDWSVGPSGHGTVHRIASLVAFICVPIAAIAIGRRRTGRLRSPARWAIVFGGVAFGWLACILGAFTIGPMVGTPWWLVFPLGLMERGMALFGILAMFAVGTLAARASRPLVAEAL